MNAFPIVKVLTVVVLVLFSQNSIAGGNISKGDVDNTVDCKEYDNVSSCKAWKTAYNAKKATENITSTPLSDGNISLLDRDRLSQIDENTDCKVDFKNSEYQSYCEKKRKAYIDNKAKEDAKEAKSSCAAAFKDYTDASTKATDACQAFDRTRRSNESCKSKVDACAAKIASFSQPFNTMDPTENENGVEALQEIATAKIYQSLGQQTNASGFLAGQGSCVKATDKTFARQEKKDKDRERKDLKEKIKTLNDDITKYKEDIDKQRNEVNEELAKIEAENKKQMLDKDKKSQEETAKLSKSSVEVGKRLRSLALSSTKEMQNLANINFEYQSAMLELTDDKISQKCTQEFESLKAGLVNSKMANIPPNASADEKKQYDALAVLAAQFKAKGIKGTGEMRTMLLNARKACFERSNTSRNKNKLINSQAVKNSQDKLDEIKNSMADENKNVALDQDNLKKLQEQTDKEKSADEAEKQTKIENLNKKLAALIKTTEERTKTTNDRIKELNAEIAKLTLVEIADVKANYSDATTAINKGEEQQSAAWDACGCSDKAIYKVNERQCGRLKKNAEYMTGEKMTSPLKTKDDTRK
jgi:hypothetical protein